MNLGKWNEWVALIANIGVVVGIIFLALEIRANTTSNRISLSTQFSTNFVQMNGDVATNPELASILDKAFAGQDLGGTEAVQFEFFISQRMAQAAMMRRLYREGAATKEDVHRAYLALRRYVDYEVFRAKYESMMNDRNKKMIFEENGVDWWLDSIDRGEPVD